MEYELQIWCVECTKQKRDAGQRWHVETFYSLTSAVQHITQYGHEVKIDLEAKAEEE